MTISTGRAIAWGLLGLSAGLGGVGLAWLLSLPPALPTRAPPPIAAAEAEATRAALKPPKRERPLIAILGINEGTETTDYLMPYGILRRADVADVVALATDPGPVTLYPVLTVQPQATVAEFDARHPDGADYVIVPAMHRNDAPEALRWIRAQAEKGAIVIGVCVGALVVAEAGLLDGKRATTHWYYRDALKKRHPTVELVADRRLVIDGRVATTTGISASMPMALTLIEAIAGRGKAEAAARDLGLPQWDARHDSRAFRFTRPFAMTAIANTAAVWNHERLGLALEPDLDEVSLALVADSWSRTSLSQVETFAASAEPVMARGGLRLLPDRVAESWPQERLLPAIDTRPPARALDDTIAAIGNRYGPATADYVASQLEYSRAARPGAP